MTIKIEMHENRAVADMTDVIEAAAPNERLWWVYIEEYVCKGIEPPADIQALIAELRAIRAKRD